MTRPIAAFFSMPAEGHVHRLLPIVVAMSRRGVTAYFFTHRRFEQAVTEAGGIFVDMYTRYPESAADEASFPVGMRSVAYAARFANDLRSELEARRVSLVVLDTFAMIGRLVASRMGLPWINVCAGHNVHPQRFMRILAADPRVRVSAQCLQAVERLRGEFGLASASPYCYHDGISPFLNVYCEPPEFLTDEDRKVFEPVAFFGSAPGPDDEPPQATAAPARLFTGDARTKKIYVSFGTASWRSYPAVGLAALSVIAEALGSRPGTETVISLGGSGLPQESTGHLARPNVSVHEYVDQWQALKEAGLFVTHHGLNSTHEAIFSRVPMISYPFFWDQPGLAAKCQGFGVATPLNDELRGAVTPAMVHAAVDRVEQRHAEFAASLERARGYELEVIAGRDAVIERMLALA